MINLVIGSGEVGVPLFHLLSTKYDTYIRDIETTDLPSSIDVIHICYHYDDNFISSVTNYINEFKPELCIIHSTVIPGTTDKISADVSCLMAYSPIRGRHGTMHDDLFKYSKFISGNGADVAADLLSDIGLFVMKCEQNKMLELTKLIETTYSALLIAFAQDIDRFCKEIDTDYFSLMPFLREVDYLPDYAFQPGYIGGKCLIPNLDLLEQIRKSDFIDAIRNSNEMRAKDGINLDRLLPIKL
jgi:UDP-glucose 6-dehydrogenase